MCDWEGCTTDTIGLPNPNQPSVAKTSAFLHPLHIQVHCAGVPPGENLGGRGMKGNPDGTSVATGNHALFSSYRIIPAFARPRVAEFLLDGEAQLPGDLQPAVTL
jgi:hypothetical protein